MQHFDSDASKFGIKRFVLFLFKFFRKGYKLGTVGSPYWMSPECLKGQFYDEKSDVFSFGIISCEMIARVEADPDMLPRTDNFGLDYLAFTEMCGANCIPDFLKLAFCCCTVRIFSSKLIFRFIIYHIYHLQNSILETCE